MKLVQYLGEISAVVPSSCSVVSHRKLFYLTFVSGKNAISVYHMTKVMGAIFHPASIERLMKVDGEGKVFNKRVWGGEE